MATTSHRVDFSNNSAAFALHLPDLIHYTTLLNLIILLVDCMPIHGQFLQYTVYFMLFCVGLVCNTLAQPPSLSYLVIGFILLQVWVVFVNLLIFVCINLFARLCCIPQIRILAFSIESLKKCTRIYTIAGTTHNPFTRSLWKIFSLSSFNETFG